MLGAPAADKFVVSAKTDKGLSLFLVEAKNVKIKLNKIMANNQSA